MYLDDLESELKGKDINFIAMAITPYHATGVNAVIRYLKSLGIQLNGYILMTAHPDTGRVLSSAHFYTDDNIKCVDFDYSFRNKNDKKRKIVAKLDQVIISRKPKRGKPIYFVWTEVLNNNLSVIQNAYPEKDLFFIKIDDGAASYLNPYECRLSYLMYAAGDNKLSRIKAYVKAFGYSLITGFCESGLQKKECFINANVFVKIKHGDKVSLERNTLFSEFYYESFNQIEVDKNICEQFQDAVVINSQGLGEFKITDGKVDFECFQKLSDCLDSKYEVVLKPHPREKELDKYSALGWKVVKTSVSQEVILARAKPKCIISIYSSTLLNAKGIFDVPVISLAKILLNETMTDTFRIELERYIDMYTGVVIFPASLEELIKIIDAL